MYIDGRLKGGFETVKAYADFCHYFKTWLENKSLQLWPPRQGQMLIDDYKDCLKFVNKQVSQYGMHAYDICQIVAKFCPFLPTNRYQVLLNMWSLH